MMVEAGANEVPEDIMLGAIRLGQEVNQQIVAVQERMAAEVGKPKMEVKTKSIAPEIREAVSQHLEGKMGEILSVTGKSEREVAITSQRNELIERFGETVRRRPDTGGLR